MPALVLAPGCAARGRVGPVPWVVFEALALAAERDDAGWIAALGVRDLAAGLGMNKDTAARAVTALTAAGLVTRERLADMAGGRRSGYRLCLPAGTELCPAPPDGVTCPPSPDTAACPTDTDTDSCPGQRDSDRCPAGPDMQWGPNTSDAELRPGPPDAETPSPPSRQLSPHDPRGPATPPKPRWEPAQADAAMTTARGDLGGPAIPADDSERAGPARALGGRMSAGAHPHRQPRKRDSSVAQDEAQGQLFDLSPAATAGSEDRPQ